MAVVIGAGVAPVSLTNMLLNPSFNTVLRGTHTTAITQLNSASSTQNTTMPGWYMETDTGSPDLTVTRDTTTTSGNGLASMKIEVANAGTGNNVRVRQGWNSTYSTHGSYFRSMISDARGKYLVFAMDVKQSSSTASACRLGITTDGTGGTTTYSSYHGANTNWERLLVSVSIPSDANDIGLFVQFESSTPDYNLDDGMAVLSDEELGTLVYEPRMPITISVDKTNAVLINHTAGSTSLFTTGDGTASTTDTDMNAQRPFWATHIVTQIRSYENGNGGNWYVFSSGQGSVSLWTTWEVNTGGNLYMFNTDKVEFGDDGQLDLQLFSNGATGVLYETGYLGIGL